MGRRVGFFEQYKNTTCTNTCTCIILDPRSTQRHLLPTPLWNTFRVFCNKNDNMFIESPYLNKIVWFLFVWFLIVSPLMTVLRRQWHIVIQTPDNGITDPLSQTLSTAQSQPSYRGLQHFCNRSLRYYGGLNSLFKRI